MRYLVIASCEDARTGVEFEPGVEFLPEPEAAQAERLIRAGCIRLIDDDAPILPVDASDGLLVAQLRGEIASLNDQLVTARHDAGKLLDGVIADQKALQTNRDALQEDFNSLSGECDRLRQEVAGLTGERDQLRQDVANLTGERDQQATRIGELEGAAKVASTGEQAPATEKAGGKPKGGQ